MKLTLKNMVKYREIIEKLVQSLSNEEALEAIPLIPTWRVGRVYENGYRVKHNETLYYCLVKHEAESAAAAPDLSPELWKQL